MGSFWPPGAAGCSAQQEPGLEKQHLLQKPSQCMQGNPEANLFPPVIPFQHPLLTQVHFHRAGKKDAFAVEGRYISNWQKGITKKRGEFFFFFFCGDMFITLFGVSQVETNTGSYQIVHLKYVWFIVCQLDFIRAI